MKKSKLMSCKACGAEIAKNAKNCPHCGAKNKTRHPVLGCTVALIGLVLLISSISGSDQDEPKKVEPASNTRPRTTSVAKQKTEEKTTFFVGEYAELNNITVSLVDVAESTGSELNKPTEGNIFVLCEFEISNDSSEEINISSLLSFNTYCDDYTCVFSLAALIEKGNKNQLDGTVAPGKKFNGVVGYEIPADWKELEIHFTPDFWRGKDITFIATSK